MTDQERRRAARHHCDNRWIDVTPQSLYGPAKNAPPVMVKVENVSATGVCLLSPTPFELDQILFFSEDDMPARGTVVWTLLSKTKCKAGVQFFQHQF